LAWAWQFEIGKNTLKKSMDVKNLDDVPPFTRKDGSEIRELLAHRNSAP